MKKLFVFAMTMLQLLSINSLAAAPKERLHIKPGTVTYKCSGARVSGTVTVNNLGNRYRDYYPFYNLVTKFWVNGRPYQWVINDTNVRPYHKPVFLAPEGTWVPDENRIIYALGGYQENFNGWFATFHLEVNQKWGTVRGYLGYKDAEQAEVGRREANTYDFSCYKLK